MAVVVQLLSRNNKIIKQFCFDSDEISVGRGYQNDFRLEDPYVCAEHLQINKDPLSGSLICQDLESVNGCKINAAACHTNVLHENDVVTIGRSRLRIFDAENQVEPTILLSEFEENISWMSRKTICLMLTFAFTLTAVFVNFMTTYEDVKIPKLLVSSLGQVMLFSLWPLLFAMLSKFNKKDTRLLSQFTLLWLFLLLIQGISLLESFLTFNFSDTNWLVWLNITVYGMLFCIFIWMTLFIAFHQSAKRRNLISIFATLLLALPMFYNDVLVTDNFKFRPDYSVTVFPAQYLIKESITTDEWILKTEKLFSSVETNIKNKKGEK